MAYIDGFLTPVREECKEEYLAHATVIMPMMREFGMTRMVECWGDDVLRGQQTDFYRAVASEEGESVVFSWIEWPDKAARDAGWARMMEDPRMKDMAAPPFDGKRLIYSGFQPIFDSAGEMA
ncbi:MAG: DUF1428 domain-containing protein [Sphingomicrobium sp.]